MKARHKRITLILAALAALALIAVFVLKALDDELDRLLEGWQRTLLDNLDDSSHKHAFEVSTDLKYALRECIELIANEAIHYKRHVLKEKSTSATTPTWPTSSPWKACATCTGCCSCSTSRPGPNWATRPSTPRPT